MIELIYRSLAQLGYTDPLHPPAVHIPMGMLLGALLFRLIPLKRKDFSVTAYHCLVLALIMLPFAAVTGLMDWRHRLRGELSALILAKIVMALCLLALLAEIVYREQRDPLRERNMTTAYVIAFLLALGLGYAGGRLAYG